MLSWCASAVEHVADDLHVAMAVRAEAGAGCDGVVVEHAQVAEAHVRGVVVVGEREAVVAVQPAMVGVAAVLCLSKREHVGFPCRRGCDGARCMDASVSRLRASLIQRIRTLH
jgi:hypothetical protein